MRKMVKSNLWTTRSGMADKGVFSTVLAFFSFFLGVAK